MVRILSPQSAWPASGMGLHARGNERIFYGERALVHWGTNLIQPGLWME
jgi:hypothetical protein